MIMGLIVSQSKLTLNNVRDYGGTKLDPRHFIENR